MPEFVLTIDQQSHFAVRLKPTATQLLRETCKLTRADAIALRTVDPVFKTLELMMFKWVKNCGFDPRKMEVPASKAFEDWIDADPDRSIGATTSTSCNPDVFRTQKEHAFIDWIGAKAWFPVYVDGKQLLFVLTKKKNSSPFSLQDVLLAWMHAQSVIEKTAESDDPEAGAFCNTMRAVDFLVDNFDAGSHEFYRAILHLLTSGTGMRWNRVLLFHRAAKSSQPLVCVAATGEVNKELWYDKLRSQPEDLPLTLGLQRLIDSNASCDDSLQQATLGIALDNSPVRLASNEPAHWKFGLLSSTSAEFTDSLNSAIQKNCADFQPSENYQSACFEVENDCYVAIFGEQYPHAKEPTPNILTSAILFYLLDARSRLKPFTLSESVEGELTESERHHLDRFIAEFGGNSADQAF